MTKRRLILLSLLGWLMFTLGAHSQAGQPIDSLLGKCPKGFWYLPQDNDGCVPEGAITEIDGVPVEKILEVLDRHRSELNAIKGVMGHGICHHGIFVDVEPDHDKLPAAVEGLPIHTHPFTGNAVASDFFNSSPPPLWK